MASTNNNGEKEDKLRARESASSSILFIYSNKKKEYILIKEAPSLSNLIYKTDALTNQRLSPLFIQ